MENRLRLLVVDEEIIAGGVETIRVNLIPELARFCESLVWVLPEPAASSFREKIPAVPTLQIENLGWPKGTLQWLAGAMARRLPDGLAQSNVKSRVLGWTMDARLRLLARQSRAACCLTTCVFSQPPPQTGLPLAGIVCDLNPSISDAIKENMVRWLDAAQVVFGISEFTCNELRRVAPRYAGKVHVAALAAPPVKLMCPDTAQDEKIDFYLPAASNPHKGHLLFFRACRLLARRGLDFRAVLSGPGMDGFLKGRTFADPAMEEARRFLEENAGELGRRILVAGDVSPAQVESLYTSAGCIVLASRYEGFGLPLAEALVRGKEIICSNIPPFAEQVVTYNAFDRVQFFEPGDCDQIAEAMATTLQSAKLSDNEEVSRRMQRWTWTDVARRCYEVLAADL
jgi:hypothetical protein